MGKSIIEVYTVGQFFKRNGENAHNSDHVIERGLHFVALPFADALLRGVHAQSEFFLTHIIGFAQFFEIIAERIHNESLH